MLKQWLIILLIPLVFQLGLLLVLFKVQSDYASANALALHTGDVIAEAEGLARQLVTLRSAVLGLALTGDSGGQPLEPVVAEVSRRLGTLGDLVNDNSLQAARLREVRVKIESFSDWMAETYRLLESGRRPEGLARIRTQDGRNRLNDIQARMKEFLAEEARLDVLRRRRLSWAGVWQSRATIVGVVLSSGLSFVLALWFHRRFARRVESLAENARRLAQGRTLASPMVGGDEVAALDSVFHAMARALAERDQENEMFIYSVSHDLRSPLVNLQGFSKELSYSCDDLRSLMARLEKPPEVEAKLKVILDEDMASSVHFIQNAVSRLSAIIDSLLRLSRAGRVEYRFAEVDVERVIRRVVEALRGSTEERGARIEVRPLPPAWADATALEQVFANLLSNAVKYLDPARPGRILVEALEPEPGAAEGPITFAVRDNGLGIPQAHQAKLFLAFQRLHPSVAPGEGVGLALARRMVERMGGKAWAESEPGVGSSFFVTLPRRGAEATLDGSKSLAALAVSPGGRS